MKNRSHHKLNTGILLLLTTASLSAQSTAVVEKVPVTIPEIFFRSELYLLLFLFIIMFIAIISLTKSLKKLSYGMLPEEKKMAIRKSKEVEYHQEINAESFWTRLDKKLLTKAVPVEEEADILLDHDYDGIKELDNKLPPWWVWGFYFTIIWAFVYLVHYRIFRTGPLQIEEYNIAMLEAEAIQKERQAKMADFVSAETITALNTPEALGSGKSIYDKYCVACHGAAGGGGVGPNFTDEYWLHGGGIKNIFKVVTDGVPAKGMISWKSQLTPKQIQQVGSYILTMQGSSPEGGKEPQGDKWVDESIGSSVVILDSIVSNATIKL